MTKGVIIPATGDVYLQPVADPHWWKANVGWWKENEYDIDFSALHDVLRTQISDHPWPIRVNHFGSLGINAQSSVSIL